MCIGDQNLKGKLFEFYIPNAFFQKLGMNGKNFIVKKSNFNKPKAYSTFGSSKREGYLETTFDPKIKISFYTPDNAIQWLESARNTGTRITTQGILELDKEITITEANKLLCEITYLLSFANGGDIAPLVISMVSKSLEEKSPTVYTAHRTDSIERLGDSWLHPESDTGQLINRLPSFTKMLKNPVWEDGFDLILTWYFQAVQPIGLHSQGKPWPIVANALGAALEKLARIVLVDEMKVVTKTKFNDDTFELKIRTLLKTIGLKDFDNSLGNIISSKVNTSNDNISWFINMRNDATHSKRNHNWTQSEVDGTLPTAIQWVEEVLLWRLGYEGKYRDRYRNDKSTLPRYDLRLRDSSW